MTFEGKKKPTRHQTGSGAVQSVPAAPLDKHYGPLSAHLLDLLCFYLRLKHQIGFGCREGKTIWLQIP
jgi:hypothetical protein